MHSHNTVEISNINRSLQKNKHFNLQALNIVVFKFKISDVV